MCPLVLSTQVHSFVLSLSVKAVGFLRALHHRNAVAPYLDHRSMHGVLAHHRHLPIGVPARPRGIVHRRPIALGPAPPLLNVYAVVTVVRPLLASATAPPPYPILEAVLDPAHPHLPLCEGEDVPPLALARPQEGTAVERTGAAIVGALRRADVVSPDLRHHPQVVHLHPHGTVGAEAQVLEAVARVAATAHLALVHHSHRVVEIPGNAIGLEKKSVVPGEVYPLSQWMLTRQKRAQEHSIQISLKIHGVN